MRWQLKIKAPHRPWTHGEELIIPDEVIGYAKLCLANSVRLKVSRKYPQGSANFRGCTNKTSRNASLVTEKLCIATNCDLGYLVGSSTSRRRLTFTTIRATLLRVVAVTGVVGAIVVSTQPDEIDLVQYDT